MQRLKGWLLEQSLSVNHRIVCGLVGSLLLSLWGFVGFWSWWERHAILAANAQVLEQLTTAVQEQSRNLFRQAETSLVLASLWMAEHPDQDPGKAPGFIALVEKLRQSSDQLIDIRMVTRDGTLRYVPDRGQAQKTQVNDRDYFRAQFDDRTRGLHLAQPVVSRVTGKLGIPISMPVAKAGGDIAVVFAAIELDRIAGTFEAERIQPRGTIAIIRGDGLFLFRSPMDDRIVGSSLASSPMWQQMDAQPRGLFESGASPVDGLSRVISYSRVQDYPAIVAVTAAHDDLLGEWALHTLILCAIATLITLAVLLLGATLLRSIRSEATVRRTLEHLMLTDPLTEVGNRRMLMLCLADGVQRAQRYQRPLTVVFIDLDHFKRINDRHGHEAGDAVLVQVARSLKANLRQSDHVARFGGEEFVLLLVETGLEEATTLVERMRAAVAGLQVPGLEQRITVSAGLAQWREGDDSDGLLRRADQALYRAKQAGRDRAMADTGD